MWLLSSDRCECGGLVGVCVLCRPGLTDKEEKNVLEEAMTLSRSLISSSVVGPDPREALTAQECADGLQRCAVYKCMGILLHDEVDCSECDCLRLDRCRCDT